MPSSRVPASHVPTSGAGTHPDLPCPLPAQGTGTPVGPSLALLLPLRAPQPAPSRPCLPRALLYRVRVLAPMLSLGQPCRDLAFQGRCSPEWGRPHPCQQGPDASPQESVPGTGWRVVGPVGLSGGGGGQQRWGCREEVVRGGKAAEGCAGACAAHEAGGTMARPSGRRR